MTSYDDPASIERIPPNSTAAEQAVIGGSLMSRTAILDAVDGLDGVAEPFYRPAHATIFNGILALFANGQPVDPITLADHLVKTGEIAQVGGAVYLHECVRTVVTPASTGHYARIIRHMALLRRIIETGGHLVQMGYEGRHDQDEAAAVLDEAASKLQALIASAGAKSETREWALRRVLDDVMADYDTPSGDTLPLPWRDLQEAAPMEPGNLVVLAGRPGMGKTVSMMDIARHVAITHGRYVHVASMEMGHREIGQRVLAAEAEVPLHALRTRRLTLPQRYQVDAAVTRIRDSPLVIDDTPSVPVAKWRTRLRQLQADGRLPAALIIDYLQIAKAESVQGGNRTGEVDAIAVGLKALAQEFQIVVIAAAQLNRSVEARPDKTPALGDLRESGGIENNANVVILLHRPDYYDKESPRAGEFDFIVAKNRQGTTATVTCAWKGYQSRITDMGRLT